jgi:hypothetical protein
MALPVRLMVTTTLALSLSLCACAKKPIHIVEPEPYGLYVDKREIDYDHSCKGFFIKDVNEEAAR